MGKCVRKSIAERRVSSSIRSRRDQRGIESTAQQYVPQISVPTDFIGRFGLLSGCFAELLSTRGCVTWDGDSQFNLAVTQKSRETCNFRWYLETMMH